MSELNEKQHAAAACGPGPQLVLAGPGTGKTTTLAARFAHLVRTGVDPSRIMAVTFTNKAARQLRQRIAAMVDTGQATLQIGTFHSLAGRILRELAQHVGLSPRFRILDENGCRGLLFSLEIFWRPEDGRDLLEIFAQAKDKLQQPDDFYAELEQLRKQGEISSSDSLFEAAAHYPLYQEALFKADACDFGDLIAHTVRILEEHESIREHMRSRFEHILVDELQDVNTAQIRFVKCLLASHGNVWAVGDDDQSIYGFRGAELTYILDFDDYFEGAQIHALENNYRSSPQILTVASHLIEKNKVRHEKQLHAQNKDGPRIVVTEHDEPFLEAGWIAGAVASVLEKGVPPAEIAVLFRVGYQASPLQLSFSTHKIPFVVRGAADLWKSPEVKLMLGTLRLALNPRDVEARGLMGDSARAKRLAQQAFGLKKQPFARTVKKVVGLVSDEPPITATTERIQAWKANLMAAGQVADRADNLQNLLHTIEEQSKVLRNEDRNAVVLSTIHGAKGLEWHTVFVIGFEANLLPHGLAKNPDEERRLAYVALTRAKRFLSLSFTRLRGDEKCAPSAFLGDALYGLDRTLYDWRADSAIPAPPPKPEPVVHVPTVLDPKPVGIDRAGHKWTAKEDRVLTKGFLRGESPKELAKKLQRSPGAINHRIDKLGLGIWDEEAEDDVFSEDPSEIYRDKIIALAIETLGYDTAFDWLRTPLPELSGDTPIQNAGLASLRKVTRALARIKK